tara:strand:- start:426 stop:1100 length:675 start_codon:yes stop_codon:yes gene_type:complete
MLTKEQNEFVDFILDQALHANAMTWATLRYSLASVDYLFKPVLTTINIKENKNSEDIPMSFEFHKEDILDKSVPEIITSSEILDSNFINMVTFSFLVPVNGVPKVSYSHVMFSRDLGVISCFFTTKDGCNHLKNTIDTINVRGDLIHALEAYVKMEQPVKELEACNSGFICISKEEEFRIYESNSDSQYVTITDLDSMIKNEEEYVSSLNEDLFEEDSEGDVWI